MLKYILSLIIAANFHNILAQNIDRQQHQFDWQGTPTYLSSDSTYFKQDKYLFGWQWSAQGRYSQAR